jgi:hypothetical protein
VTRVYVVSTEGSVREVVAPLELVQVVVVPPLEVAESLTPWRCGVISNGDLLWCRCDGCWFRSGIGLVGEDVGKVLECCQ